MKVHCVEREESVMKETFRSLISIDEVSGEALSLVKLMVLIEEEEEEEEEEERAKERVAQGKKSHPHVDKSVPAEETHI